MKRRLRSPLVSAARSAAARARFLHPPSLVELKAGGGPPPHRPVNAVKQCECMAYSREQLKSVFNRAVEVPVADRPALLDRLGLDPDLRRQVEGLLAAHVDAASFLEGPAVGHLDMSSEHGSSLSPGSRLGPYEVVDFLGAGGMGQVYRARDTRLRREVALKVLQPEIAGHTDHVARFRREATAAAALSHPNICTIYEIGDAQGQTFIAMEYVAGQTLQARLAGPPLTMTEVLDIAIQLADGLNEARQRHVVHRDLKSANVVLTARGQVKSWTSDWQNSCTPTAQGR